MIKKCALANCKRKMPVVIKYICIMFYMKEKRIKKIIIYNNKLYFFIRQNRICMDIYNTHSAYIELDPLT